MATFDNDAKACYDRIIPNAFNLRSKQLGVPTKISDLFTRHIQLFEYAIKTSMGESTKTYRNTVQRQLFGIGQGGRASTTAWLITSVMLIDLLKQKGKGMLVRNPTNTISAHRHIDAFVDDCTYFTNDFDNSIQNKETNIQTDLQQATQWWEQLLHATGGKLELNKCFFYNLQWEFDAEGNPNPSAEKRNVQIKSSETGETIDIAQRQPQEPHRTLGFHMNPMLTTEASKKHLQQKATSLTADLMRHHLTSAEADMFRTSIYRPSMAYTLPFTYLKESELSVIEKGPVKALIRKMGYNKSFPRAIAFAQRNRGGLEIPSLSAIQQQEKIFFFLKTARQQSTVAPWMEIARQWVQTIAGTSFCIFAQPRYQINYLTDSWFTELRHALALSNTRLHIPNATTYQIRWVHDQGIMDMANDLNYPHVDMVQINAIRLYLQVDTLADIATELGDALQDSVKIKKNQRLSFWSTNNWPKQRETNRQIMVEVEYLLTPHRNQRNSYKPI